MVDTLLAAGAVLHAQTAAPELCFISLTWSQLWGVTRNSCNLPITVGNRAASISRAARPARVQPKIAVLRDKSLIAVSSGVFSRYFIVLHWNPRKCAPTRS
jgi:Asp-tRNA(Asn)/Glu-tRNA(Gln) amidotransferase A subunit family amidase